MHQTADHTKSPWSHLWPFVRHYRLPLAVATLAMLGDAALTAFRPWPLKIIIDRVLAHKASKVPTHIPFVGPWLDHAHFTRMDMLYGACGAVLAIAVGTGLLTYFFTRILGDVGQHVAFDLRLGLFAHMQRLSLGFLSRQRSGDLLSRLTSDISAVQDLIATGLLTLGSNAFLLASILSLMFWLDWKFALATLAAAPLLFWTVFLHTRRIKTAVRQARYKTGLMASLAKETLSSIRLVQGLAQEDQLDDRFAVESAGVQRASLESVRYQARLAPLVDVLAAFALAVVMWFGATRVLAGSLTTGDMIVFFAYVTNFYGPVRALSRLAVTYNKAAIGVERIGEVLSTQSEVLERPDARTVLRLVGRIEFQDVSFEYEPGRRVLHHLDLRIKPQEKVALVGATGAGKSTLVSLVSRFFDPVEGCVRIDGEDVRNFTLQSLREQISLVLQDTLLFSGSVRDNIAFGRPDATDEQIRWAAGVANAGDFIRQLPNEYDTWLVEAGANLSGGQKQRIAIARAILRNAPILILDEPTSALDPDSERAVMDALQKASAGRTTLIIAHRMTTVRFADRIIVLENGRIVETGTHAELLARNGRYANYYRLQMIPDESPESIWAISGLK